MGLVRLLADRRLRSDPRLRPRGAVVRSADGVLPGSAVCGRCSPCAGRSTRRSACGAARGTKRSASCRRRPTSWRPRGPAMTGEGLVRLGELRRRQGKLDEASALFERAGSHPIASLGRALIAFDRGDFERRIRARRSASPQPVAAEPDRARRRAGAAGARERRARPPRRGASRRCRARRHRRAGADRSAEGVGPPGGRRARGGGQRFRRRQVAFRGCGRSVSAQRRAVRDRRAPAWIWRACSARSAARRRRRRRLRAPSTS